MPSVATPSAGAVCWVVIRTPPPTPAWPAGTSASTMRMVTHTPADEQTRARIVALHDLVTA